MELLHGEAACSSVLGRPMLRLRVACREVADAAPARPPDPLCVVLALDRSGSMHGSPLEAAKRAACAFAQHVAGAASELGLVRLELLCFDHEVQSADLYGQPASWVERTVRAGPTVLVAETAVRFIAAARAPTPYEAFPFPATCAPPPRPRM